MSNKLGRNDPCWCGSGRKYKRCHLDRDLGEPIKPWTVDAQIKKHRKQGKCLHAGSSNGSICNKKPIGSHTVPRKMLKQIARNGHVYNHTASVLGLSKTNGHLSVELIGISKASVVPVFCKSHDNDTFAPIEETSFSATKEQCFLLTYRAICLEIAKKKQVLSFTSIAKTFDQGRPLQEQASIQRFISTMKQPYEVSLRDAEKNKKALDTMLQTKNYNDVRSYIVTFKNVPDILCAAAHYPQYDFTGRLLQDLSNYDITLCPISFSLIPTEKGGAFVFSWIQKDNSICEPLAASLDDLPDDQITHAIVRYVFEFCENHYLHPDWWEALSSNDKKRVTDRVQCAASPAQRLASCLTDDDLRLVSWTVSSRAWL